MLTFREIDSPAYTALPGMARAALVELIRQYNGHNNGSIGMSVRFLADRLGCSKDTAGRALDKLEEIGFITPLFRGGFTTGQRRASEYRLNYLPCNATGLPPQTGFLKMGRIAESVGRSDVADRPVSDTGETDETSE